MQFYYAVLIVDMTIYIKVRLKYFTGQGKMIPVLRLM
jgi:hypothetical protein